MARLLMARQRTASRNDLTTTGSCDTSYSLGHIARFRVNIFPAERNHTGIVMRKLQSKIPTLEALGLPPIFRQDDAGEIRHHLCHR